MQTINFYLESYRPKPLSFDSRFAFLTIIISILGLLLIGSLEMQNVNQLQASLSDRQKQLEVQQQQLATLTQQLKTHSVIANLQKQLQTEQQELTSYQKIIALVNLPISIITTDFSVILSDLAELASSSLWLTRIDIQPQNLSLHGSANNPDAVPEYVNQLSRSKSLRRLFDELKIIRNQVHNQLIDFELINGRLVDER